MAALRLRGVAGPVLLALWAVGTGACATSYSEHLAEARAEVDAGDYEAAVASVNDVLDVSSTEELPDDWGSNTSLALLERASLLQAVGRWDLSARDYTTADDRLERLDLRPNAAGRAATWLFSEEAQIYRATPTERIALNSLNIINFLAMRDLVGARVEAKRMTVMREYLQDLRPDAPLPAFASYLAGFVFEMRGEADEALHYYDEVLRSRDLESLAEPVARLARRASYRGRALEDFLKRHGDVRPRPDDGSTGDLLVVVGLGRVPHEIPERIPVGTAVGLAGVYITADAQVLERTALKWVVFGDLVPSRTRAETASVRVGGEAAAVEEASDLSALRFQEWEHLRPRVVGAAVTRLIVRAAAAEGTRAAVGQKDEGLGALAALVTEGTMLAADKPDTRSWTFLPGRVLVTRQRVPAGTHTVQVRVPEVGVEATVEVEVPAGSYGVAYLPVLR
ncbi:MAG: hypothetical protein ACQEXJ_17920 [Myxococcota bacterium]